MLAGLDCGRGWVQCHMNYNFVNDIQFDDIILFTPTLRNPPITTARNDQCAATADCGRGWVQYTCVYVLLPRCRQVTSDVPRFITRVPPRVDSRPLCQDPHDHRAHDQRRGLHAAVDAVVRGWSGRALRHGITRTAH